MKKLFFTMIIVFSFSLANANSDKTEYPPEGYITDIASKIVHYVSAPPSVDRCKFHHDLLARSCVGTNGARCAGAQLNLLFRGCW